MSPIDEIIDILRSNIQSEHCFSFLVDGCPCCKRWTALIQKNMALLEAARTRAIEPVMGIMPSQEIPAHWKRPIEPVKSNGVNKDETI